MLWVLAKLKDKPEREEEPLAFDDGDTDIPPVYQDVVRSCLSKQPEDRKSATDLLALLSNLDSDSHASLSAAHPQGNRTQGLKSH